MDISVIILSYNGKELLAQTLDAVNRAICFGPEIETIVADNGSTDGSIEMVKQDYPWVKLVENNQNLGFSAGNNRGVEVSTGRYVLFLNSDTKVEPNSIQYVYERMENDSTIGAATCRVELANGEIDPASHRGFPTPWRSFCYYAKLEKLSIELGGVPVLGKIAQELFGGYHLVAKDLQVEHQIESCTGAFMMVRRDVGEKIGWWDEAFFMYGEDLDICYKIYETGRRVMYFPQVKIIHYKYQSGLKKTVDVGALTDAQIAKNKAIKQKTTNAFYDAMTIFYDKHYKNKYPGIVRTLIFYFIGMKRKKALARIG